MVPQLSLHLYIIVTPILSSKQINLSWENQNPTFVVETCFFILRGLFAKVCSTIELHIDRVVAFDLHVPSPERLNILACYSRAPFFLSSLVCVSSTPQAHYSAKGNLVISRSTGTCRKLQYLWLVCHLFMHISRNKGM